MNVAQAMAMTLTRHGARDVFALMGGGNLRMIHHLVDDHGVAVHHVRHEASAVSAADAYARVTGGVGICTVTHGPGFTNTITALLTALRARTPLVLITTDSSETPGSVRPFATVQALRPELLLDPLGVPVVRLRPEAAAIDTARACELARRTQGPVALISAAGRDGEETTEEPADPWVERPQGTEGQRAELDPTSLNAALMLLTRARNPFMLAGRGVVAAGAASAVRELAHRTGAGLLTTLPAAGIFAGDPNDRGIAGGFSTDVTVEMLRSCDCLIAFAAGLNWFTTRRGDLLEAIPIVHVDSDPAAFGKYVDVDVAVHGDVREVLAALLAGVADHRAVTRTIPPLMPDPFDDVSTAGALDPRAVAKMLHDVLPADRAVVIDAGHFSGFPVYQIPVRSSDALLFMADFGAVGTGLSAGAGAALGRPERPTVAFVGDGGLFMTLSELDLMVRDRVPLLVVCMNDQAYGSELVHLQDLGLPEKQALFDTPDIAAIAAAIGCGAERISSLDQLRSATCRWLDGGRDGTLVLDVPITRTVRSPLYDHI